jgi:tetratricopeptide (TPR) repeat protein
MQAGDYVVVNQSLLMRARIYREQGNFIHADAMLTEVEPRLRKALPLGHLAFAALATEHSALALARGDLTSALQQSNRALAIAEASIKSGRGGDDYMASILVPRSEIERERGRADHAVADATRALNILQKAAEPGKSSSYLGHAYSALGRALQAQGKSEEADAAFRAAADNLQTTLGPDHSDTRSARQLAGLERQHR